MLQKAPSDRQNKTVAKRPAGFVNPLKGGVRVATAKSRDHNEFQITDIVQSIENYGSRL